MLTVASVFTVFFLVARGVTVGTIHVDSSEISFNTSFNSYQILLTATIPIYNPNYMKVRSFSGGPPMKFPSQPKT